MAKPNIIFILSDQHRFCDVGYQGNKEVCTPNLDAMSEEGAYFEHAYSSCPVCVPARGSIFTGLHALHHGATANDMPVRTDIEGLGDVFKAGGYNTAYIGKWHLGGTPRDRFIPEGERLGFDYWRAYNCNHEYTKGYYYDNEGVKHFIEGYEPEGQTDLALQYMEQQGNTEQPYFLTLAFAPPHGPYRDLPEEYLKPYDAKTWTVRGNYEEKNREMTGMFVKDIQKAMAEYYAHIEHLDLQVGRILNYLKESGHYENTIVVYSSDHGDMLRSHGLGEKQYPCEESAKVPFVMTCPGHIVGGRRTQPISSVDIAPTLAGLAGLHFKNDVDGVDCSSCCLDANAKGQRAVYFYSLVKCHIASLQKVGSWRAVSTGKMMLGCDHTGKIIWMYDMEQDPLQMKNLVNDKSYEAQRNELKKMLDAYVEKNDGYRPWILLLGEHHLEDEWFRSEHYFAGMWGDNKLRRFSVKMQERAGRKKIKNHRKKTKKSVNI